MDLKVIFSILLTSFVTVSTAYAQTSSSIIPTIKLRCQGLSPSSIKKGIVGTLKAKAALACPECKKIKVRVSLTYPKQLAKEIRADTLVNGYHKSFPIDGCSADAWDVGPVCIEPSDGSPFIKAASLTDGSEGLVGSDCQIAEVAARINLSYVKANGDKESKQLNTIIDLGGIGQ